MRIDWKYKKEKLLRKFSTIDVKDLDFKIGNEKELLRRLRDKLGKSEEEILNIIIDL